jgi:phosphoadenosine phosphosulfate reductase
MSSLEEKLTVTRRLLESLLRSHHASRIAVAWTGGKDSTVVLDVWREVLRDFASAAEGFDPAGDVGPEAGNLPAANPAVLAINLDTGYKFPEILAFRDRWAAEWGLDLRVIRPGPGDIPVQVATDRLACCHALKVRPLRQAIEELGIEVLLTGIRADENPSRTDMAHLEDRLGYCQANPILDWTEMDVWAATMARGLPYCELYDQGYRSLGCVPCTAKSAPGLHERSGRDQEKEARMAELRALGYF